MAKSKKTLEENSSALKANRAEMKQLRALEEQMNDAQRQRIELLEKENTLLEKNISSQKRNKKAVDSSANAIRDNNKFLEDSEDIVASIADKVGKSNKLYKDGLKYLESQKIGLASIATITTSIADPKLSKAAEAATNAYKKFQQSVARVADKTAMTGKQQEEANVAIARARKEYDESVTSLAKMGDNGQGILNVLTGMANRTEEFGKSVTVTTKEFHSLDALLGSFSGIPALSEMNALLKTSIRDTLAWKAAVFALGAALGKAAYDYFGAPIKAGMQADKERKQGEIDNIAAVAKLRKDAEFIPAQISQERLENEINSANQINQLRNEAAYAGAKAAIQFSASMQQGAAQFERAAKTALFGNKLGSVGYGAAQLQLAGISADKIASGMEAASAATGKMPTAKAAADMAIMADRTGQSVDSIASINEMFQRVDGATESTAMNLSEGLRTMANQAGIGLGGLMKEMAEASKDMLGYQIKSGPALAKQVAYASSLGVSFGDIAKAGKSMVMNYKDSIKNEMQLSAMLGKNVDLSEVRAKFASGDTEGAMKSLQAQGLDPADMDMFQQDALQQALGGMDLSSLQKISKNKGADVGGLKEGKAGAANQDFLSRTQSAESALSQKQASISANTAIIDAKLSQKIADAYLASPEYENYKKAQNEAAIEAENLGQKMKDAWLQTDSYKKSLADSMQLDFVAGIKENLMGGLAAVAGGIGTSLLNKIIPGGGGGGGAAAGAGVASAAGASSVSGAVTTEATAKSGGVFAKIGDKMDTVITSISGVFTKIKDGILGAWEKVTGWFTGIGTKISELWGKVTGFFSGIGTRIKDGFMGFVTTVKTKIMDGWNKIIGFFSGIVDTVKTFFKTKVAGMFKKGGLKSMAPGGAGGGEEGGGGVGGAGVASQAKSLSKVDFKGAGKGIGSFLSNVGKGAGALIKGIMTGIAQGLMQFANPVVVAGAAGLAASIALIGAGLAAAAWIMGKVLPTLAEGFTAFNEVDGANLKRVGIGIAALGVGMAAMGAGAVIGGIGNLVGSLFGGGIEDTIKKVEKFAAADINVDKVKNNADAVIAYSKAMAASGLGSAASGIGNLVGGIANGITAFFGGDTALPLDKMKEFGKTEIANADTIKKNAETFTAFATAMDSYKGGGGSIGGVLAEGLGKFFDVEPPIDKMKTFGKELIVKDTKILKANAEAFTVFGTAMASYKGSGQGIGDALAQGVSSFLKVDTPLDKFIKFAALTGIDVKQTKNNAEAFTAFGTAMSSYTGEKDSGFFASLGAGISSFFGGGKEDLITKFQRFAALDASGVTAISTAIGSFNANLSGFNIESAEAVGKGMKSVASSTTAYLTADRTAAVNAFASSIGFLNSQLMQMSGLATLMDVTSMAFLNLASALDRLAEIDVNTINDMPWKSMALFSKAGGRITLASSANNSFNMTENTAKAIMDIATNTIEIRKLNNTIAKLIKEGFFGGETTSQMKLFIDGKDVSTSMKRYKDNTSGNEDD